MSVGIRFFSPTPSYSSSPLPATPCNEASFWILHDNVYGFFFYFFIAHGSKFIGRTKATKMFEGRKPWTRLLVVGTCWTCLLAGGKSFDWKLKISWWAAVVWLCRSELTDNVNFLYRFMRPPVSEVFRQSIDDP